MWDGYETTGVIKALNNVPLKKIKPIVEAILTLDPKAKWNGPNTAKAVSALMFYDATAISSITQKVIKFQEKNSLDYSEILLAILVLGGYENEECLSDLGDLIRKSFPKISYEVLDGLAVHEPTYRKTVLSMIGTQGQHNNNILLMSAFVPEQERKDLFGTPYKNLLTPSECLLTHFASAILQDSQNFGNRKKSLLNHWEGILRSQNRIAANWIAEFILKKYIILGLDQEEDNGLYQLALRTTITLDNITDEKNPYFQFFNLLEKRKIFNPKEINPPVEFIENKAVSLNPEFFEKISGLLDFDPKSIPEVSENDFNTVCDSLKNKGEEIFLTLNTSLSELFLKEKLNYLSGLFKEPSTRLMASQWKCIVNYILKGSKKQHAITFFKESNKPLNLSEQQERAIGALNAINNCQTGKEEGIRTYYSYLTGEFKLKAKNGNMKANLLD